MKTAALMQPDLFDWPAAPATASARTSAAADRRARVGAASGPPDAAKVRPAAVAGSPSQAVSADAGPEPARGVVATSAAPAPPSVNASPAAPAVVAAPTAPSVHASTVVSAVDAGTRGGEAAPEPAVGAARGSDQTATVDASDPVSGRDAADARPGSPAETSAVAAAKRWGCSRDAVVRMVQLGHVPGGSRMVGSREHWHVLVDDWSLSLRDRVAALQASRPPLPDVTAMRRFDEIRVKSGCEDLPVDEHWITSFHALPDRYVGNDHPQEIRAVLTASDEEVSRISRILQLMEDDGRLYADRVTIPGGDLRDRMIAGLSPGVPPLEFTWLHPTTGRSAPPIDDAACARILRMPPGHRRDLASVHAASAAANGEMIQLSVQALSHDRAGVILDGVAVDDAEATEKRWTAFLRGELMSTVGRSAVVRTFHDELACERTFLAMAEEPVSPELKNWLRWNAPLIPDSDEFRVLVREKVDASVNKGVASRKRRSDVISDAYDDHAGEAEAALEEARTMYEGIAKGHRAARDEPAYEFSFPMPIRGAGRRHTGGTMLVDMISFRCDALLGALAADADARGEELTRNSFLRGHAPDGDRHTPALARRRFAVFVGVEALDPSGGPAADPSMIERLRVGAMLAPGMLPDDVVVARRELFARTSLPIPTLRPRGLVGGGDPFELNVMLWGLRSGLVVVPAAAFVQGCSIGNLFYRMSHVSQVRGGTGLQLVDDRAGFGLLEDETGRKRPAFRGIPKLGNGVAVLHPLDDETLKAFRRHIALTLEIEGTDGRPEGERMRLPLVNPSADHPPACVRARYAFQARGRALTGGDLNYCLSHLFGRLVLSHDPRHGGANRREQEGQSRRQIADALGHKSTAVTGGYSRPTPRQRRAAGGGAFISIRDALARLGVGRDL